MNFRNFLSSTEPPSINRIIPVITPNNFLLTSRGRVVYGLLTVDKYNDSINDYISDEFRQYVHGRKMNYNESDIEKVISRSEFGGSGKGGRPFTPSQIINGIY